MKVFARTILNYKTIPKIGICRDIANSQIDGRKHMNKKRIFILILAIAIVALTLIIINRPWTFKIEYETADSKDYRKCLSLVDHLNGVKDIFPKEVPSDVMDVDFACYSNLGGKLLKLSYIATSAEIKEYQDKAASIAVCFGEKDTRQVMKKLPEYRLADLNDDDLVYVLDSEPYKENDFNHAKLVWVIVNENRGYISFNAVVY